jgi:hypothetical protein
MNKDENLMKGYLNTRKEKHIAAAYGATPKNERRRPEIIEPSA